MRKFFRLWTWLETSYSKRVFPSVYNDANGLSYSLWSTVQIWLFVSLSIRIKNSNYGIMTGSTPSVQLRKIEKWLDIILEKRSRHELITVFVWFIKSSLSPTYFANSICHRYHWLENGFSMELKFILTLTHPFKSRF